MSAGRRDLLTLHAKDKQYLERFRQIALDVSSGKLPAKVAADALGISTKTLARTINRLEHSDSSAATYAPVTKWSQLPSIAEFEAWLGKNAKARGVTDSLNRLHRIWREVFQSKPLQLLTEQDFVAAVVWSRQFAQGTRFSYLQSLRSLVRFGFGQHAWLSKHLGTTGTKSEARMPTEISDKTVLPTVVPRIFAGLDSIVASGHCTAEEGETVKLVIDVKRTLWARTGDVNEEREVFGTRINAGKSHLDIDGSGRIVSWVFFCKRNEVWTVGRQLMQQPIAEALERYIRVKHLVTGDLLFSMKKERARQLLREACKRAGMRPLVLHDFRKMGLTVAKLAGVPLEVAITMYVGWKDIKTAYKHYLAIGALNAEQEHAKITSYLQQSQHSTVPVDAS